MLRICHRTYENAASISKITATVDTSRARPAAPPLRTYAPNVFYFLNLVICTAMQAAFA